MVTLNLKQLGLEDDVHEIEGNWRAFAERQLQGPCAADWQWENWEEGDSAACWLRTDCSEPWPGTEVFLLCYDDDDVLLFDQNGEPLPTSAPGSLPQVVDGKLVVSDSLHSYRFWGPELHLCIPTREIGFSPQDGNPEDDRTELDGPRTPSTTVRQLKPGCRVLMAFGAPPLEYGGMIAAEAGPSGNICVGFDDGEMREFSQADLTMYVESGALLLAADVVDTHTGGCVAGKGNNLAASGFSTKKHGHGAEVM